MNRHSHRAAVASVAVLSLAACGGGSSAPAHTERTVANEQGARGGEAEAARDVAAVEPASGDAGVAGGDGGGAPAGEFDVRGRAQDDGTIDVTASSDLPAGFPSTAQPYVRIIEQGVAPLRPALAECLRPLGRARRSYRVTVERDGRLEPRPPQPLALPNAVASCAERVVRGTRLEPAPPLVVPYDIYFDVR